MTTELDYELFISYRHRDNAIAQRIHHELAEKYDIRAFRDEEGLHFGDFRHQLIRCNKSSKYLLLLVTEHTFDRCSQAGDWITTEISLFLKRGKPIIPVLIGKATIPDTLPPEIMGVKKYAPQAIVCPATDPTTVARFVGESLRATLRRTWTEEDLKDSPARRARLSRDNTTTDGYFCKSAKRFRRYAVMALLMLLMWFFMGTTQKLAGNTVNITLTAAAPFPLFLLFVEHHRLDRERNTVLDMLLDRSVLDALVSSFWPLVKMLVLTFLCTAPLYLLDFVPEWAGAEATVVQICSLLREFLSQLLLAVLSLRLLCKLIATAVHFCNCLFGRYPDNLYVVLAVDRAESILRTVGWILLVPAAAVLGYLRLKAAGIL